MAGVLLVIPAQAGIQGFLRLALDVPGVRFSGAAASFGPFSMDPGLRRDDEPL